MTKVHVGFFDDVKFSDPAIQALFVRLKAGETKEKMLKDPAVRAEYERLRPEYEAVRASMEQARKQ